jgi:hypothetical protein
MRRRAVLALVTAGLVAGCGSDDSGNARAPSQTPQSTTSARPASIVGRWEVRRTCEGMVKSLDRAGLRKLAPSVVGDYFPGKKPKQLARKADPCQGATPQQHSHFFTTDGKFGSVDQHQEQVDDAAYGVGNGRTLRLKLDSGEEIYRYRIVGGDQLMLEPVIPARSKREALAAPLAFGHAGHAASVAYAGHIWHRVPCGRWC